MDYRAYFVDKQGHFFDVRTFVEPSDEEALVHAHQYSKRLDIDVWNRARHIGLIPALGAVAKLPELLSNRSRSSDES